MNYKEALDYVNSFIDFEKTGLDHLKGRSTLKEMKFILREMGDPHLDYYSVHIAGTKGKGSVSVFASSILGRNGYSTGLYLSPHMNDIRERISVNGSVITQAGFVEVVEELDPYLKDFPGAVGFSFFEIMTLLALLHFRKTKVDYAVLECGLGGRLDATNVVDPAVCAITPVSFDHMRILGEKIEQIASEKAAIIKEGSRCVSSPQRKEVEGIIREKCAEKNVSLSVVGKDIIVHKKTVDKEGSTFDICGREGEYTDCATIMPGYFQLENCALAVGIYEELMSASGKLPDVDRVKEGIYGAFIPGRLEVLGSEPLLVIDGAQNSDSAGSLRYSVEQIFDYDRLILLLGVSSDKDIEGVCRALRGLADKTIVTRACTKRAADPFIIKGFLKGMDVEVADNVNEAIGRAYRAARKKDLILATGSFYVIGEVRKAVLRGDQRPGL